MLKKTMTYEDYNGVPRTEDFYFNLTPAEVTEMELSVDGGLVEMINRVVAAQDGKLAACYAVFEDAWQVSMSAAYDNWPSDNAQRGAWLVIP